jgi:AcrR family transcriptional regulator
MVERSFYHPFMPSVSDSDTKKKLLDATERLIYAGGICATGMDAIVKESGVARKTIYRYFPNKDELVAEALRERDLRWMRWFIDTSGRAKTPAARLLACFDALEEWFARPEFRGCAFINAAGEIGDSSGPIRAVAKEHKIKLRDYLYKLATELPAKNADEMASAFLILIDGAITVALVTGKKEAAKEAQQLARQLLLAQP